MNKKSIKVTAEIKQLITKAVKLRQDTLLMFIKKKEAHLGGSYSMIEIIIALYKKILKKMINLY